MTSAARGVARWTSAVLVVLVTAYAIVVIDAAATTDRSPDHELYLETVEGMRSGAGYYDAAEEALREWSGPVSSVRAFRLPTIFVLWRLLPDEGAVWIVLMVLVGAVGVVTARWASVPWVAPVIVAYFVLTAYLRTAEGAAAQFTIVELWAAPLVLLSVLAWTRDRPIVALVAAGFAASVRELAVLVVVGGLIAAVRRGAQRWLWTISASLVVVGYAAHALAVRPHLDPSGDQFPLLGTATWSSVMEMTSNAADPAVAMLSTILWGVASVWVVREGEWDHAGPVLALPLLGLVVDRPYWGILVAPVILLFSIEAIARSYRSVRGDERT